MSSGQYVLGVALTIGMIGPLVVAGVALRAQIAPRWQGATAVLADAVLVVGLLVVISEVLGLFGQFRRWPVLVACIATGVAVPLACARRARAHEDTRVLARVWPVHDRRPADLDENATPEETPVTCEGRASLGRVPTALGVIAAVAVALVVAQWSAHVVHAYQHGIIDGDSIWYHLPFSARFLQTGWTSRLHFTNADALVTFFPANSEMLDAALMLPFHRDLLVPVVNLGWLAMALLSGWCIGRRFGTATVGLCGAAVLASLPLVASTQAGTARNDAMAVALVLATVALLLHSSWEPGPVAIAGAAAGLALGTKLNLIAPVGLLTLGVLVVAPRRRGVAIRLVWLGALVMTGGFWYLRNLAHTGNPLPWLALHVGPLHLRADPGLAADVKNSTLADHLGDSGLWGSVLRPGLHTSFGPLWPLVLALGAAGVVAVLVAPRRTMRTTIRMLAAVAAVAAVVYVFTPNSATDGGAQGSSGLLRLMFLLNLRYSLPALAIALVLVAAVGIVARPAVAFGVATLMTVVVLVDQFPRTLQGYGFEWRLTHGDVRIGLVVGALVLAAGLAVTLAVASTGAWPRAGRARVAVGALVAVLVLAAAGGWPLERHYSARRYHAHDVTLPVGSVFPWAQGVRGARIGLTGDVFQYPLYGPDLSNHVQYVGVRGPRGAFRDPRSCATWQRLLRDGRYDYVVFARSLFDPVGSLAARAETWTTAIPGARVVVRSGRTSVARMPHTIDRSCP